MLMRLRDRVPASVALLGLRSRQDTVRRACSEVLRRRVQNGEWDIIDKLYRSKTKSYFRLFFELLSDSLVPAPNEGQQRSLAEFRRLQLVIRPPLDQTPEGALTALRSMRPRHASLLFGEAVVAIRRGRIGKVLRMIAMSGRKQAQSMIIATEAAPSDGEFEELLELYVKLNASEINSEKTPSANAKAEELARVIRRLTTVQRSEPVRRMFARIELKPSARDIVVALLANGDLDDVTAILLKIGSFPHEMYYANHMELCFAAKETLLRSSREMPQIYISWVKSRNFWKYFSKRERSSAEPNALLPLRNEGNRPLFIRLLAHAIVGLVRSSDDTLLRSLLHHDFTTIASAAAIRMSELTGDAALSVCPRTY